MNDQTNDQTTAVSNDTRRDELFADSRELGREMALGKDSLPKWALKIARAAADGVISLQKKAGEDDDITELYKAMMTAASKKAVHEHTAGGIKSNASKVRQIAVAATKTTCEFIDTLHAVAETRIEEMAKGTKVRPAYHAFVEAARTQNGQDEDLSKEQIMESILKPDPAEQTEEKILERVTKTLEDLVSGEKGVKSDSPQVEAALGLVRERHAEIVLLRERNEVTAKAQALGLIPMVVAPSVSDEEKAAIAATFASNERAAVAAYVAEGLGEDA